MKSIFALVFSFMFVLLGIESFAQVRPRSTPQGRGKTQKPDVNAELDSLRRLEDEGRDTLIITAKFVRYTTIGLLQDSTQTLPLDTTFRDFRTYHQLNQAQRPTVNLGNLGLAAR